MNCWTFLDVEPTSDKKRIKKAYAVQLKQTKPDVDPEGFKQLHSAYKEALSLSKHIKDVKNDDLNEFQAVRVSEPIITIEDDYDKIGFPESHDQYESEVTNEQTLIVEDIPDCNQENEWPTEPQVSSNDDESTDDQRALLFSENIVDTSFEAPVAANDDFILANDTTFDIEQQTNKENVKDLAVWNDPADDYENQPFDDVNDINAYLDEAKEIIADSKNKNSIAVWSPLLLKSNDLFFEQGQIFRRQLLRLLINDMSNYRTKPFRYTALSFIDSKMMWCADLNFLERHLNDREIGLFLYQIKSPMEKFRYNYICDKEHKGDFYIATFGKRFGAIIIDLIVFGLCLVSVLSMIEVLSLSEELESKTKLWSSLGVFLLLFPILEASPLQATIGKSLFKIKVVNKQGKRLNIFHSLWRSIVIWLLILTSKITFLIHWIVGNEEGIAGDRMSYTRVIER